MLILEHKIDVMSIIQNFKKVKLNTKQEENSKDNSKNQ